MVTTVGTESGVIDMLNDLIQLDYDAIQAYEAAIGRIETTASTKASSRRSRTTTNGTRGNWTVWSASCTANR